MTFVILAGLTLLGTSLICYLAALLATRLGPENAAWSTLWSAGLWVTLFTPLAGLFAYLVAPQSLTEWTETGMLPAVLPVFVFEGAPVLGAAAPSSAIGSLQIAWLGLGLYGVGAGLALLRLTIGRRRVRKIAKQARASLAGEGTPVHTSDMAEMPFVWTPFLRPKQSRMVLPTHYLDQFSDADLQHIIAHERAHVVRRDDEHGLLLRIMLAVLWISPFAHLSFARWSQACELQCDAQILKGQPDQARAAYAQVLIGALQISANRVRQYPAAAFSNDRLRNEKMRIAHIMSGNGPVIKRPWTHGALVSAAALFTLAGGAGLAGLAHADPGGHSLKDRSTMTLENIVTGRLTAPFGKTFDPFRDGTVRVHRGIDIGAPIGTAITAPADGLIMDATDLYNGQSAYGKVVVLQTANETLTLFSHLDSYSVQAGQRVKKGQKIAEVGNTGKSTGPHVHIETMVGGERVDPLTVWSASP